MQIAYNTFQPYTSFWPTNTYTLKECVTLIAISGKYLQARKSVYIHIYDIRPICTQTYPKTFVVVASLLHTQLLNQSWMRWTIVCHFLLLCYLDAPWQIVSESMEHNLTANWHWAQCIYSRNPVHCLLPVSLGATKYPGLKPIQYGLWLKSFCVQWCK